jgi:hypothetical protein
MEIKDKIAIILSSLAFIVSASTAFFSLREEDDIRAVLQGTLWIENNVTRQGAPSMKVFTDQRLTLMNSGNRAAALSNVELHFRVSGTKEGFDKCEGKFEAFGFDAFEPSSVKPNDVTVIPLKFVSVNNIQNDKAWKSVPVQGILRDDVQYLVCIAVTIVTPTHVFEDIRIPTHSGALKRTVDGSFFFNDTSKPFVLVRQLGFFFWPTSSAKAIN